MIQPEELRCTNLINTPDGVQSLHHLGMINGVFHAFTLESSIHSMTNSYFLKDCSAISLTEDRLVKFGCKSIGKLHPTFRLGQYIIEENLMRTGKYFIRQIINKEDSLCISKEIEFVHTFQNAMYVLMGTELTIKE